MEATMQKVLKKCRVDSEYIIQHSRNKSMPLMSDEIDVSPKGGLEILKEKKMLAARLKNVLPPDLKTWE